MTTNATNSRSAQMLRPFYDLFSAREPKLLAEMQKKHNLPSQESITEEGEKIAVGQFVALIQDLLDCGYPDIGLNMGVAMPIGGYGSLSFLMLSSATFRDLLNQYCHYYPILAAGDRSPIWASSGDSFFLEFYPREGSEKIIAARSDFTLASTVCLMKHAFPNFRPSKVCVYGDGYTYRERYKECLNTSEVIFNADTLRIYAPIELLDKPLPSANPSLCKIFRKELDMLLREMSADQTVIDQIHQLLARLDNLRDISLAFVAEQLNIGERTLTRQLAEYEVSFRDLLANYKSTRAIRLLAEKKTVDQVSYYLGFSERAAFDRAFKKWQGVTASRFQEDYAQSGATQMDILSNDELPNLPMAANQILNMINDGNYNMDELAIIVEQDPSLTAKLLALANSAMYGVIEIGCIKDAIVKVFGVDTLRNLALAMMANECFDTSRCASFSLKDYWINSLAAGMLANDIAKASGYANASDSYLLGLLHNIGTLLLVQRRPDEMSALYAEQDVSDECLSVYREREQSVINTNAFSAGSVLAAFWNLPRYLSVSIRVLADKSYKGESAELVRLILSCEYYTRLLYVDSGRLSEARQQIIDMIDIQEDILDTVLNDFKKDFDSVKTMAEGLT